MRLTQLSSWRLPSAPTYLISHDHVPGPESTFRFVPLWHTVEVIPGRLTGLPWRWRDWAYWLENVAAKSCSTRPRVVSGVHAARSSAAAPAAHTAADRLSAKVVTRFTLRRRRGGGTPRSRSTLRRRGRRRRRAIR